MPYVSKDDIMVYIGSNLSVVAGQPSTVELILYKDYINNQLNAADADSITVSLYNSLGQKMYQYSNPVVSGITDLLTLGSPATSTQGYISFSITPAQSTNLANGNLYAQVTITYSNYYPSAKTYIIPQLMIGTVSGSSISGGGSGSGPSGSGPSGSGSGSSNASNPYVRYHVSSVAGVNPSLKSMTFDSSDPTQVTSIKFYNLDQNNVRNVLLENYLAKRDVGGSNVNATITVINADSPNQYAIYDITGYNRINAEVGGGDDNDNDFTEILVTYEDNSYSPVANPYVFQVGDNITYMIDTYGGAAGSGVAGAQGAEGPVGPAGPQGAQGDTGLTGANGADGAQGAVGPAGPQGDQGLQGAQGDQGLQGAQGDQGLQGAQGDQGLQGAQGDQGLQGLQGSEGPTGPTGPQGPAGLQGAQGADGAQGAVGPQGAQGIDGAQGATGAQGDQGLQGAQGADGAQGVAGAQGVEGPTGPAGPTGAQGDAGLAGAQGAAGAQGSPGMGITFKGAIASSSNLPTSGMSIGDAYIADDTDHLYVWDGSQWIDGGSIQGPQGAQGATGATGAQGDQGLQGAQGADGAQGATGAQGDQGLQGSQGADGAQGATGAQGDQGLQGAQGADGLNGAQGAVGAQGSEGPTGATGPQGAQGSTGAQGVDGAQGAVGPQGAQGVGGAQGAAGSTGAQGDAGLAGAQGAVGPAGPQGAQGDAGSTGAQGDAGLAGAQGAVGPAGPTGAQGDAGPTGAQGDAGLAGAQGADGPIGAQGPAGYGIPTGGTSGQSLVKIDSNPYNVQWATVSGGSGSGTNKYLLRLEYDASGHLVNNTTDNKFIAATGFLTSGASVSAVSVNTSTAVYTATVSFNESNPPLAIQVLAWDPATYKYEVHAYRVDAALAKIDTGSANFSTTGTNQLTPDFWNGAFTTSMTIDVRKDFIKYGNKSGLGASARNPHAYLIFVF